MSQALCNLDGRILPEASVTISVLDRGFLFGDSIYEVVRTHRGRLFGVERHFDRLAASARSLDFELPFDLELLDARIRETLDAAQHSGESYVRIIVTRGSCMQPNIDPAYTIGAPLVLLLVRPLPEPDPRWRDAGLHACLVDIRRNDKRALDPAIKSGNYLNNILGLIEAKKKDADVALFLNCEGQLTESETSNVWLVQDGELRTPSLDCGILAGITRDLVLELARREGLPCRELELDESDLRAADEIFLTSTTKDVAAITRLDGQVVGEGRAGPVTVDLAARFARELDRIVGFTDRD